MPANLTPQYHTAEKQYRQANTIEEKLEALREMLAVIPKHKGTDKLQADIKRRISQLKEQGRKQKTAAKKPFWVIEKVGAGQVPVIGAPNAGKSALIARLTSADVRVADYPFTTQAPAPAMMTYENIQIQLIDTPPWSEDFHVDWIPDLARRADACVVMADLSDAGAPDHVAYILEALAARDVVLIDEVPDEREGFEIYIPTLLAANKSELPEGDRTLDLLQARFGERFPVAAFSVAEGSGLEEFGRKLFEVMKIARVFTKTPGKEADLKEPFVLPVDSTVRDLAGKIHKDFLETLRYARLWGRSGKFQGQRVGEDHVLEDGDVVELHTH